MPLLKLKFRISRSKKRKKCGIYFHRKCQENVMSLLLLHFPEHFPSIFLSLIIERTKEKRAEIRKLPLCKFRIYDHYIDTETQTKFIAELWMVGSCNNCIASFLKCMHIAQARFTPQRFKRQVRFQKIKVHLVGKNRCMSKVLVMKDASLVLVCAS